MAGGRYDGLVSTFGAKLQEGWEGSSAVGAVGVNIAVEKIVSGITFFFLSSLFPSN